MVVAGAAAVITLGPSVLVAIDRWLVPGAVGLMQVSLGGRVRFGRRLAGELGSEQASQLSFTSAGLEMIAAAEALAQAGAEAMPTVAAQGHDLLRQPLPRLVPCAH